MYKVTEMRNGYVNLYGKNGPNNERTKKSQRRKEVYSDLFRVDFINEYFSNTLHKTRNIHRI